MKKPPSSDSLAKIPRLTPELSRFIEGMGMYFENQGIPRIGGRMLGLLMIAHRPLSAEDLARILKVSRASLSTNFRALLASGLVEKVTLYGDRTTYFVFSDAAMEHRTVTGTQGAIVFRKLVQQGLAALPPKDPARRHLDTSLEWSDLIIEAFQQVLTDWQRRHTRTAERSLALRGV
jgi:DNA-binding transcriptional regulator GbsR (MarR family)